MILIIKNYNFVHLQTVQKSIKKNINFTFFDERIPPFDERKKNGDKRKFSMVKAGKTHLNFSIFQI